MYYKLLKYKNLPKNYSMRTIVNDVENSSNIIYIDYKQ